MKQIAICIGNNEYEFLPKLNCAVNDAKAVSEVLSNLGFETSCECNLNRSKMVSVLSTFIDKLKDYDSCVIYYAGHGCQIDGENILAPTDLDSNAIPNEVKLNAYPLESLMRSLDKYPNITKVFIFDACRTVLGDRGVYRGFAPVLAPQGSIIAFATSPGQSSGENDVDGHGIYTSFLLKYIDLPRVNIETVFKKTREQMVSVYGTRQIPWEHTSLIGDFYLNPNTIYDGMNYSPEALADKNYAASNNEVKKIVAGLKSGDWYVQEPAIKKIDGMNFESALASDLFVIGRNVYQAACGNSFAAQAFINGFTSKKINETAKLHLLNGMAYEIYFSPYNKCRIHPKSGYYSAVIQLLESEEFYGSKSFIVAVLCKIENQIIYIPGQNERMDFIVEVDDDQNLKSICYKGKNVLFGEDGGEYDVDACLPIASNVEFLKTLIAKQVVAPNDCITIVGDNLGIIQMPGNITLRRKAVTSDTGKD